MAADPLDLARALTETLAEKKGEDVLLLDLVGVCAFTDYFVIATGLSERTLQALADEILRRVKGLGDLKRPGVEGSPASGWLLIDMGAVVVHLFSPHMRQYYRLEELWRDGRVIVRMT